MTPTNGGTAQPFFWPRLETWPHGASASVASQGSIHSKKFVLSTRDCPFQRDHLEVSAHHSWPGERHGPAALCRICTYHAQRASGTQIARTQRSEVLAHFLRPSGAAAAGSVTTRTRSGARTLSRPPPRFVVREIDEPRSIIHSFLRRIKRSRQTDSPQFEPPPSVFMQAS